jgi:hypothetical protein
MYVGSAFVHHAHLETAFDKAFDFDQALICYREAARVFAEIGATEEASRCEKAIKKLLEDTESVGIEVPSA